MSKPRLYTNNVNTNSELDLIKEKYSGILADLIPLYQPMLISNADRLDDILTSSVAKKKPVQLEDGTWKLEDNTDDTFVNKKYKIDFLKQDIIVVRAAKISKVNFVEGKYKITFSDEKLKDYMYYAVLVQAPSGCAKPKSFTVANEKPEIEDQDRIFIS